MLRTFAWFSYLIYYMITTLPELFKVKRLEKSGNLIERDKLVAKKVQQWAQKMFKKAHGSIQVMGAEQLPPDKAVVFISNHQSNFDILVILGYIDKPAAFISKIEVLKLPIIRSWMRLMQCVFMNRKDLRQSAHAMQEEKDECFKAGMDAFLSKPIVERELVNHIKNLTHRETIIQVVTKLDDNKAVLKFEVIDLTLLSGLYHGAQKSIINIAKLCMNNVPTQLAGVQSFYENKNWEALRVAAHTVKSSFNYLGMNEAKENCKTIEVYCVNTINLEAIPQLIHNLNKDWKLAERDLTIFLSNQGDIS